MSQGSFGPGVTDVKVSHGPAKRNRIGNLGASQVVILCPLARSVLLVAWRGGVVSSAPNADLARLVWRLIDNAERVRPIDPRVQNGYLTSLGEPAGPKLFQTCHERGPRPVSPSLGLQLRQQAGMLLGEPTRSLPRKWRTPWAKHGKGLLARPEPPRPPGDPHAAMIAHRHY
jgi:hypothetical protein